MGVGADFIVMLVEGSETAAESKLRLTEGEDEVKDSVRAVMPELGLAAGEKVDTFVRGAKY